MPPMASAPRLWQISGSSVRRFWKNGTSCGMVLRSGSTHAGSSRLKWIRLRHVVPAPEVEPQDVLAQVVEELLHLVGERDATRPAPCT